MAKYSNKSTYEFNEFIGTEIGNLQRFISKTGYSTWNQILSQTSMDHKDSDAVYLNFGKIDIPGKYYIPSVAGWIHQGYVPNTRESINRIDIKLYDSLNKLISAGYKVPLTDSTYLNNGKSLSKLADKLVTQDDYGNYIKTNAKLTKDELMEIFDNGGNRTKIQDNIFGYYNQLTGNSLDYTAEDGTTVEAGANQSESLGSNSDDSGLSDYAKWIKENLPTSPNSDFANQYKADMYGSINSYQQQSEATLQSAELDAYRLLGQQQLQLESEIANQRMTALKSGTTSAQLASQQLASIFAAQSEAQQVAASALQNRVSLADQYNQQRASVTSDLYSTLNQNRTTLANAYAQLGTAQASYNSYMQQPYAQYKAAMDAYTKNPSAFKEASLALLGK